MTFQPNIFTQDELTYLTQIPAVLDAQKQLEKASIVKFQVELPNFIKHKLSDAFGIDLSSVSSVPFRWIRGDTLPHIDFGSTSFDNTHLVYLTDGEGEFKIGDDSYAIEAGSGFTFPEGTRHEVVNTNGTSRLLLGPMSEQGLQVGYAPNIYIRQNAQDQQYSADQTNWYTITWPFTLYVGQTVEFTTDLTLTDVNAYLVCDGNDITIGSKTVKPDGTLYTITISGVENYPGFIQNNGNSNVKVYNLSVEAVSGATLADYGGWIGHQSYGSNGIDNYIVGCSSSGAISSYGGGIVGAEACTKTTATSASLYIVGCISSGSIGARGGGIAGNYCGQGSSSTVYVVDSASSGSIGQYGGGIVGQLSGQGGSLCVVLKCYSRGAIGSDAGGIFGTGAGDSGTAVAQNCYSRGTIGTSAGGIFGSNAASSSGASQAINCYCIASGGGQGIYGTGSGIGSVTTHCYVANINWSDVSAISSLTDISAVWISILPNTPFSLKNFGPSPYSLTTTDGAEMTVTYSQTVTPGSSSIADVLDNRQNYLIVQGGHETITIDSTTGVISTTSSTPPGTYTLILRTIQSTYFQYITTFVLTVAIPPPPMQKKVLVQDASAYTRTKKINVSGSGGSAIDPTKLRAPQFYSFYKPYYDVHPTQN